jgi:hypothetical protein
MTPSQQHAIALSQATTIAKETAAKAHRLCNRDYGIGYLNNLYRNNTPLREAALQAYSAHLATLKP